MIGLPFYRLLIAAGLVLASALATTPFGHAEPQGLKAFLIEGGESVFDASPATKRASWLR